MLVRYGGTAESVFELLGQKENDLTAAFGYSLARCRRLYIKLIRRLSQQLKFDLGGDPESALEISDDTERTALEVGLPSGLLVCEAKRDWLLPETAQLRRYASRVHRYAGGACHAFGGIPGARAHATARTAGRRRSLSPSRRWS